MTDYKNEYQKFADDAVRGRAKEEGFGRLRIGVFWAVAGGMGAFLTHMLKYTPPKPLAWVIVGTAPVAVVLMIVNFIRLPNESKATAPALLISFVTLLAAGGSLALSHIFGIFDLL